MKNHLGSANTTFLQFKANTFLVLIAICFTLSACTENPKDENETLGTSTPNGFFGNMQSSDAFTPVKRGYTVAIPRDHMSHPDFQLEWWYLTFVLSAEDGQEFGLQYTLFRFNTELNAPPSVKVNAENSAEVNANNHIAKNWTNGQQWMGHASLHTAEQHYFEERFASGGVGNAYVNQQPFTTVIDDWAWKAAQAEVQTGAESKAMFPSVLKVAFGQSSTHHPVRINGKIPTTAADSLSELNDAPSVSAVKVSLNLDTYGPFIKQGDNGYSKKTQDERLRSYYYSQPFINAKGTLNIEGNSVRVTGKGWFDHEWTSHLANSEAMGWDWFSLHLDDGSKLMAFRMHAMNENMKNSTSKHSEIFTTASYIAKNGTKETIEQANVSITPTAYETINEGESPRSVPTAWRIQIPEKDIDLFIRPFKENQWNNSLFPYYEGRVEIKGSHSGSGFMELTGY
ncbi:lipocalin-like domain-containing protein [Alteromonas macleodii]|mgnify:CR=1 FL=1|jgi:predicted secreted hydrolase|uniref:lipocalin-like domain-containing protein n=1 Tax=Alteromonas TaxID=226 RepID=UPI000C483D4C|nr:lipocalin-like domain-containing protein [Alteromonas macleodii]MAW03679.1 hydrolase [Alteromonas sp.]MBR05157.1 hydrolase [Alteromonas sp.]MCH2255056.1 hydrolase [Alteromonas sp.]MDK2765948.1 hydrolase [Alteromonas macleodii]MDM7961459.1 lipocalin-like domain-containing protein [Alteromonas macleodii]|tara:strand:+ start:9651 stop:11015 length:1365 start_codon:yes stop_codon:yes gene_type:complete